jgi:hypothetical protein
LKKKGGQDNTLTLQHEDVFVPFFFAVRTRVLHSGGLGREKEAKQNDFFVDISSNLNSGSYLRGLSDATRCFKEPVSQEPLFQEPMFREPGKPIHSCSFGIDKEYDSIHAK